MKGSECCGVPCRYWRKLADDGTTKKSQGQCRRHPPRFDQAFSDRFGPLETVEVDLIMAEIIARVTAPVLIEGSYHG